ncbi:uncharacterized protein LOC133291145 [Gastrolobium bilobum]|uniref:uncharacterized protein LOC133291145 n=1 Tax=Gastrolobium bilobum TaxID=150636 RepID=UPI002AB07212|nr:uncharacterized protein LOC133291145 [Gastrolobium bilobum]
MYFPREARESKEKEFLEQKQGSMTIDQYLAKFNDLAKYANYRRAFPTPTYLAAKFQCGLCEKIAKTVSGYASRDLSTLIKQCKSVEGVYGSYKKSSNVKESDPKGTTSKMSPWKNNKGKNLQVKQSDDRFKNFGNQQGSDYKSYPKCVKCGKFHKGICWKEQNLCFKCGQSSHFMKDCPHNMGQGTPLQAIQSAPTVGRVFTIDPQKSGIAFNPRKGTIYVVKYDVSILMDYEVLHSCITNIRESSTIC